VLNLPVLTNITGQACQYPVIQAAAGGTIIMTNLATILAGPLAFQADGTSSLIDLNALVSASGQDPYPLTFEASAGGTIKASIFAGGPLVDMILNPGGNLPLAQLRQLFSITANNGAVASLPALTNLDGARSRQRRVARSFYPRSRWSIRYYPVTKVPCGKPMAPGVRSSPRHWCL
jgi:hypothetical protein